jgi:hypothetical protein
MSPSGINTPGASFPPSKLSGLDEKGFALPVILGISLIIIIISFGITAHLRSRVQMAQELGNYGQAFFKLRSGYAQTLYGILSNRYTASSVWIQKKDGSVAYWNLYGQPIELSPGVTVKLRDTAGMVPLLHGGNDLKKLVYQLSSDRKKAAQFADSLLDWQDADNFKRLNGAEAWQYRTGGYDYVPRNHYVQVMEEIRLISGFSPEIFDKFRQSVTYYPAGHRNYLTMDRQTLDALIGSKELVDTLIELRGTNDLSPARFRRITGIPSSMSVAYFPSTKLVIQVVAEHGEAKTGIFAVIDRKETQNAPFQVLEWRK